MCGIVGFLDRPGASYSLPATIRRMASSIRHRGPDDEGVWCDAEAGIALGQRRLSIVDLSPAGHQPMASADARHFIVFNGEIYNHAVIRAEVERDGPINWRGHSDTEVLLEAISLWGVERALDRCVGMFAFAVWDRRERLLTIARDRLGEKPLYYGQLGSAFAFASELKALQEHSGWNSEVDRGSLALLMRHGYVPAPYSIFRGIYKLRPGHVLVLDASGDTRIFPYWSARSAGAQRLVSPFRGTAEESVDSLDHLLRESLRGQMLADVPLGAFLSGGIDSSTIVAVMQSLSSRPIQTFTIGFESTGYNEADHAKRVSEHLGTDHAELYVSEREARSVIPLLPEIYCEPFADPSQIPTYLVAQLAKKSVTVALSGDGGDELFSGYTRYRLAENLWEKFAVLPIGLRSFAAKLATLPSPAVYDGFANSVMKLVSEQRRTNLIGDKIHKAASLLSSDSVDEIYLRLCSQWRNPQELVIDAAEPPTMLSGLESVPDQPGAIERMMYIDMMSYLPDDILVKVDRAAMAVSLETRVPFLDHRLVEFSLSLPLSIARAGGVSKWPLRQLLYRYVPKELVDRPKMGFGVPIDDWLRGPLREWAEDLLNVERLKREGYFNHELVRRAWTDHLSGRRNNQYPIWNVLMFQAWLDRQSSAHFAAAA